jgi:hypothetical protein
MTDIVLVPDRTFLRTLEVQAVPLREAHTEFEVALARDDLPAALRACRRLLGCGGLLGATAAAAEDAGVLF